MRVIGKVRRKIPGHNEVILGLHTNRCGIVSALRER